MSAPGSAPEIATTLEAILLAAVLLSAVTDLLERRIFNVLTLPLIVVGIAAHAIAHPAGAWWQGLAGFAAVGIPFLAMYAIGDGAIMGAGDVKLMMAVGALGGLRVGLSVGIGSVVVGGILSFALLVGTARLGNVLRIFTKHADPSKSLKAPFGLAIAIAATLLLSVRGMQ